MEEELSPHSHSVRMMSISSSTRRESHLHKGRERDPHKEHRGHPWKRWLRSQIICSVRVCPTRVRRHRQRTLVGDCRGRLEVALDSGAKLRVEMDSTPWLVVTEEGVKLIPHVVRRVVRRHDDVE